MGMMMRMTIAVLVILAVTLMAATTQAFDVLKLRKLAREYNVTCVLVFGDSSVDPGNNNRLATTFKGNFPPYGKDLFNGKPTGRFSNGKLPTDFIAEALGYTDIIPGFLEPNLKVENLLHGVSFASAASGYDDLTANITNVLPVSKQLEDLKHYKIHLRRMVGKQSADKIIRNAIFILSMGTNDFIQNYYFDPTRSKQFTVEEYGDFLLACLLKDIKGMHVIGATRLAVVGVPPIGCMPLAKTLMDSKECVPSYNHAALSFNNKVRAMLPTLKTSLGMRTLFVDAYALIESAVKNPTQYGFTVTSKGCCGSGLVEYGDTCKGLSTCEDRTKYVFWDAVHPTEKMYKIIADASLRSLYTEMFD